MKGDWLKMIYFTSDTHFCHNKPFLYEPRGFKSIEEHDETIVKNWNSIIKPEDEVYHLGDVMLINNEKGIEYLKSLNGKIHLILGNHCTDTRIELYESCPNIVEIVHAAQIKYKKNYFFLCHYPTCVGNFDDNKKIWCLCGHSHTKDKFVDMDKKSYHVELDCQNNFPIEITNIIKDINKYRNNRTNMTK